jgi:phage-related protein
MPTIGSGCHELRIVDVGVNWRLMYHIATDAIVVLEVFAKKTPATPKATIDECRKRLELYRAATLKVKTKGVRHAR